MPPGVYVALPSVLPTASATFAASVSLSEPLAVTPLATSVAVAVLTSGFVTMPEANATGAVKMSVFAGPASRRAAVAPKLTCPVVPVMLPQLEEPVAKQTALPLSVTPTGNGSAMVRLSASDTPVFVTVTVYIAVPPGMYVALPSVLSTASITFAASASLSEPLAVLPLGRSVAVAVFTRGFVVMPAANPTGMVKTSAFVPPASTRAPVVPKVVCPMEPVITPQLDVPPAVHVAFAESATPTGSASATVTFSASVTPELAIVTE